MRQLLLPLEDEWPRAATGEPIPPADAFFGDPERTFFRLERARDRRRRRWLTPEEHADLEARLARTRGRDAG